MTTKPDPRRGVPRTPLFYTLDQVATMLALSEDELKASYLWFEGQEVGRYLRKYLRAVRFQKASRELSHAADWRVPEGELIRWLHYNNLWVYDPLSDIALFDQPMTPALSQALTAQDPQSRRLPPRHRTF